MLLPSTIYALATILLSFIEAVRFKIKWGKVDNINHAVSRGLAIITGSIVGAGWLWYNHIRLSWWALLSILLISVAFIGIRLALYDPLLNLFRLWTGTNPTRKIDYVSSATNDYEDQHSEKLPFWAKRAMGAVGWLVMFLLYKVIFKV
jgi:hypothetical protein